MNMDFSDIYRSYDGFLGQTENESSLLSQFVSANTAEPPNGSGAFRLAAPQNGKGKSRAPLKADFFVTNIYPSLSTPEMLQVLRSKSRTLRHHTMQNISQMIITDNRDASQRLKLGPHLLPALLPLLDYPSNDIRTFAMDVIPSPRMALTYLRFRQLPLLMQLLLYNRDPSIKAAAASSLRVALRRTTNPPDSILPTPIGWFPKSLGSTPRDAARPIRSVLAATVLPFLNTSDSDALDFLVECLPTLLLDFFEGRNYHYAWPFVFHAQERIRELGIFFVTDALRLVGPKERRIERRVGALHAGLLEEFEASFRHDPIAEDIQAFYQQVLPTLGIPIWICGYYRQLFGFLQHRNVKVRKAAIITLRVLCSGHKDGKKALVDAGILPRLLKLLKFTDAFAFTVDAIRLLRLEIVQSKDCQHLIGLMNHPSLGQSAESALAYVMNSGSVNDKNSLRRSLLLFISTTPVLFREVVDFAVVHLPPLITELVEARDLHRLLKLLSHPEGKIRTLGREPLLQAINSQYAIRQEFAQNAEFQTLFMGWLERASPSDDNEMFDFAVRALPALIVDFIRGGKILKIISLLDHKNERIRGAARGGFVKASRGSLADQRALLNDPMLPRLKKALERPPLHQDLISFASRFISNIAVAASDSVGRCTFLLELLLVKDKAIKEASTSALNIILQLPKRPARKSLGGALFLSLEKSTSEPFIQFACTWQVRVLYVDLVWQYDMGTLARLWSHPDPRIRDMATTSLTSHVETSEDFRTALSDLGLIPKLRSLANAGDLYDDVLVWAFELVLPHLFASFVENGQISEVIRLTTCSDSKLAAASAKLVINFENAPAPVFIPAGTGLDKLLELLDHRKSQVRLASQKELDRIMRLSYSERRPLRNLLVHKFLSGTPNSSVSNLLISSAEWVCRDLVESRDVISLYAFLGSPAPDLRDAYISALARGKERIFNSLCDDMRLYGFTSFLLAFFDHPNALTSSSSPTSHSRIILLSLVDAGALPDILSLLSNPNIDIPAATFTAVLIISNSSEQNKKLLVEAKVILKLAPLVEAGDEAAVVLWAELLPNLGLLCATYDEEIGRILTLSRHVDKRISKACNAILTAREYSGPEYRKPLIRDLTRRFSSLSPADIPFFCDEIRHRGELFLEMGEGNRLVSFLSHGTVAIAYAADAGIRDIAESGSEEKKKALLQAALLQSFFALILPQSNRTVSFTATLAAFVIPHLSQSALENGHCKSLVALLRFPDTGVIRAVDKSIRLLSDRFATASMLVDAGIIRELLQIVDGAVDSTSLDLLCFLSVELAELTVQSGKPLDFLTMLNHPDSALYRAGVVALIRAAEGTQASRNALVGSLEFLNYVRQGIAAPTTKSLNLYKIITLLGSESAARSNILLNSLSSPLVTVASTANGSGLAGDIALYTICNLTKSATDCASLVQAGLFPSLASIRDSRSDMTVLRKALEVAENVLGKDETQFSVFDPALRGSLISHLRSRNAEVVASALKCCSFLINDTAEIDPFLRAGISQHFVMFIEHQSPKIVLLGCNFIRRLAYTPDIRKSVGEAALLKALKNVSSLTHRSKMTSRKGKKEAQQAASDTLLALTST